MVSLDIPWLMASRLLLVVLLHFVWQATLVCMGVAIARTLIHPRNYQTRYAVSVSALILIVVSVLGTTCYYAFSESAMARLMPTSHQVDLAAVAEGPLDSLSFVEEVESQFLTVFGWFDSHRLLWLSFWSLGVLLLVGRLIWSLVFCFQLRRSRVQLPPHLERLALDIKSKLKITRKVVVASSQRVTQAVATGIIKPVVLIPASWITELPVSALEAVLAHELSHVKRWDLWVNMLQKITETVFFFHPLLWWLSKSISAEREICCDQMAINATGKPLKYVETLATVAKGMSSENLEIQFGTAFNGGKKMKLLRRAKMILEPGSIHAGSPLRAWTLVVCVGMFVSLGSYAYCSFPEPAAAPVQEQEDEREVLERIQLLVTYLEDGQEEEEVVQLQALHNQLIHQEDSDRKEIARQLRKLADQLESGGRYEHSDRHDLHIQSDRRSLGRFLLHDERLGEEDTEGRRRIRVEYHDGEPLEIELSPESDLRLEGELDRFRGRLLESPGDDVRSIHLLERLERQDNEVEKLRGELRLREREYKQAQDDMLLREQDNEVEQLRGELRLREREFKKAQDDMLLRERGEEKVQSNLDLRIENERMVGDLEAQLRLQLERHDMDLQDHQLRFREHQDGQLDLKVEPLVVGRYRLNLREVNPSSPKERIIGRELRMDTPDQELHTLPGETNQGELEESLRQLRHELDSLRREFRKLKSDKDSVSGELHIDRFLDLKRESPREGGRRIESSDGKTLYIDDTKVPMLSNIPYLSRLFSNVSPGEKKESSEQDDQSGVDGALLDFDFQFEDGGRLKVAPRFELDRSLSDARLSATVGEAVREWSRHTVGTLERELEHQKKNPNSESDLIDAVKAWSLSR